MNAGDLHRGTTGGRFQSRRSPLSRIGVRALLVALGLRRRATGDPPRRRENREKLEGGRGRSAIAPSEIPARGWKDILRRIYEGISEDRILANAAAVTFYSLLALFPAIAALVSIYGLFADPNAIAGNLDSISGVLPSGAINIIRDELTRLTAHGSGKLSISFVVGVAVSIWTANGGIKALFDALNVVHEEKEKRSFFRLNVISLAFTIAMILFLLVALACVIAVPIALNYLPGVVGRVVNVARWPVLLVLVAVVLAFIYRYGPSHTEPHSRWISWGSAFAAAAWLTASALFSWYAAQFGNYDKTYGSLGAAIGFMTWMWLSIIVVLLGAKLNAEIER
jgi:membrane protein